MVEWMEGDIKRIDEVLPLVKSAISCASTFITHEY